MKIEVSVITINYNGFKDTCELLATLPLNDESLEVIVVDNASREDEASMIESRFPQVKVVRSKKNLGFAGGNNLGYKAASGKYLFFLNNDTILGSIKGKVTGEKKSNVFQPLIDRLESAETIGMVSPKIRFSWDNNIQYAGYTPLSPITLRNHAIGYGEEDCGQHNTAHVTPYAHGAAMMVKREAIDKAGLMPECYFLYYEELDWSIMMRRSGYEIWYEPAFTVYHKESRTTGQASPLRIYYTTRNRLLFVKRNSKGVFKILSYLYLLGPVAIKDVVLNLLLFRTDLASAVIKGITHFIIK
jgi:GT2 family glycosyltransferase